MFTHTYVYVKSTPKPGGMRQANLCEFKNSMAYRVTARTARGTPRNTLKKMKIKHAQKGNLQEKNYPPTCYLLQYFYVYFEKLFI